MNYDAFLDREHEAHFGEELEQETCKVCAEELGGCICEIEQDDWDADDYETVYDYEEQKLEVVK